MSQPAVINLTQWPEWWEFLFQWAGLMAQAIAAGGTVAAVFLALRLARRDTQWRIDAEERQRSVIGWLVMTDVVNFSCALQNALSFLQAKRNGDPAYIFSDFDTGVLLAYVKALQIDACWKLLDKLVSLPANQLLELSRLMAQVPMLKENVLLFSAWKAPVGSIHKGLDNWIELATTVIETCESLSRKSRSYVF